MAETEARAEPRFAGADLPAPDVSIVVTLYNEASSLEELYRRTVEALDSGPRTFELIFVDDGSTDGTFAALERLHHQDGRVRAVRFKRNFGQHPAMHAGLSRARAQGPARPRPAVARDQRHAAALHRRRDHRLRLCLQRVSPQRGRADARVDRQAEVHESAGPLRRRQRDRGGRRARAATRAVALFPAAPDADGPARPRGLLATADPVDRRCARRRLLAARVRARNVRGRLLDRPVELPRPAVRRRRRPVRPRDPGLHPRARRGVPRPHSARRRGAAALHRRQGAVGEELGQTPSGSDPLGAAERIASFSWSWSAPFLSSATAPASRACSVTWGSTRPVTRMTFVWGLRLRKRFAVSIPSTSGIRTSITATSAPPSTASSIAVGPSLAVPITSSRSSWPSRSASASTNRRWSSTMTTRTGLWLKSLANVCDLQSRRRFPASLPVQTRNLRARWRSAFSSRAARDSSRPTSSTTCWRRRRTRSCRSTP